MPTNRPGLRERIAGTDHPISDLQWKILWFVRNNPGLTTPEIMDWSYHNVSQNDTGNKNRLRHLRWRGLIARSGETNIKGKPCRWWPV